MIVLHSSAGLCNRLRALSSTLLLAKLTGHRLRLCWERNKDCGASYLELFQPIDMARPSNRALNAVCRILASNGRKSKLLATTFRCDLWALQLEGKLNWLFYPPPANTGSPCPLALDRIRTMKLVCIRSDHAWLYPHDFSWLRPTRKIQQWIDGTTSRFQGNVVGIHIRRGDFTARQTTPLKAFVAAMDARLAANPGTSFFLCSDDASIKTELASRYSGKLVTRETDPSRDSPAGLESAAADLFCLSRCDEILGSKGSSFSEVAHHIGRTRLSFPTIPSPNHHGL